MSLGFDFDIIAAGGSSASPHSGGHVKDEDKITVFISDSTAGHREVHTGESEVGYCGFGRKVGASDGHLGSWRSHSRVKGNLREPDALHLHPGLVHEGGRQLHLKLEVSVEYIAITVLTLDISKVMT